MRISEKTLELSITSQLTQRLNVSDAIWFGLTQRQEREFGYDIASNTPGRLVILQFKASSVVVHPRRYANPRRKFSVPHEQLVNLQFLANAFPDSVYYVFPDIGTTEELEVNKDLVSQSWLLDVASLPDPFPAASNASQTHHAYIEPPLCDIRSEPLEVKLASAMEYSDKLRTRTRNSEKMAEWLRQHQFKFRGMRAYGLLIPAP